MPSEADHPELPDIEIGARVKAKSMRFKHVPHTETRKTGEWETRSERKNLPDEVEPGVTYRDVEITWHTEARGDEQ
jgi:hypothetical protein